MALPENTNYNKASDYAPSLPGAAQEANKFAPIHTPDLMTTPPSRRDTSQFATRPETEDIKAKSNFGSILQPLIDNATQSAEKKKAAKAVNLDALSGLRGTLQNYSAAPEQQSYTAPTIPQNVPTDSEAYKEDPSYYRNSGGRMRTDRNNNPTAMTTDVARTLGLVEGVDYTAGDPFSGGVTARLIGDPINTTIKALDRAANPSSGLNAFYTRGGQQRWTHTAISNDQWNTMSPEAKRDFVIKMYKREGGSGELAGGMTQAPKKKVSYSTSVDDKGVRHRYSNLQGKFLPVEDTTKSPLAQKIASAYNKSNIG